MKRPLILLSLIAALSVSAPADDDLEPIDVTKRQTPASEVNETKPLLVSELLASSNRFTPQILASAAQAAAASGQQFSSLGVFDTQISAGGFSRVTGFWDGSIINTEARKYIGDYGAQIYGGYRISDGSFPIYENVNFTNTLGETKVGALFSLLRNRDIDKSRFTVRDSALALEQAELDVLLTRINVQRQALAAYWRWVAAGKQLKIYENLLAIALDRQRGIDIQIAEGAIADIFRLENQQNITRRRTLVTQARQTFMAAANGLSFYLRDSNGQKVLPVADQVPDNLDMTTSLKTADADTYLSTILQTRPELRRLRTSIARAEQKIELAQNDLKPQLDFRVELSHDFGNVAEGGPSFDSTDTIVGFNFSIPIGQRAARGKLQAARAERQSIDHQLRGLEDQIAIEIRNILVDLATAQELLSLAQRDVTQTKGMEQAEIKRFQSGASDFFVVNVREENAANAKIREFTSLLQLRVAEANYAAAVMNLGVLGIEGEAVP